MIPLDPTELLIESREFDEITERTKRLLQKDEGLHVDYKQSLDGLKTDDLVSFANSKAGGTILIGVKDVKDASGRQYGEVVGCSIADGEKRSILTKAQGCFPPVAVSLYVENAAHKPFYRIEIASGPHKPYCTSGGTYKIRGDAINEALYPPLLLSLFLETQTGEFLARFRAATETLEQSVATTKKHLSDQLDTVDQTIADMQFNIESTLQRINAMTESAEENAQEANAAAEDAKNYLEALVQQFENFEFDQASTSSSVALAQRKLNAVLDHLGAERPEVADMRSYARAVVGGVLRRCKQTDLSSHRKAIERLLSAIYKDLGRYIPKVVDDVFGNLRTCRKAYEDESEGRRLIIDRSLDTFRIGVRGAQKRKPQAHSAPKRKR